MPTSIKTTTADDGAESTNTLENKRCGSPEPHQHFSEETAEFCRHINAVGDEHKKQLQLILEQLTLCREELRRDAREIREEMRRGFAETQIVLGLRRPTEAED